MASSTPVPPPPSPPPPHSPLPLYMTEISDTYLPSPPTCYSCWDCSREPAEDPSGMTHSSQAFESSQHINSTATNNNDDDDSWSRARMASLMVSTRVVLQPPLSQAHMPPSSNSSDPLLTLGCDEAVSRSLSRLPSGTSAEGEMVTDMDVFDLALEEDFSQRRLRQLRRHVLEAGRAEKAVSAARVLSRESMAASPHHGSDGDVTVPSVSNLDRHRFGAATPRTTCCSSFSPSPSTVASINSPFRRQDGIPFRDTCGVRREDVASALIVPSSRERKLHVCALLHENHQLRTRLLQELLDLHRAEAEERRRRGAQGDGASVPRL